VTGWMLDAATEVEIDAILGEQISDPIGPEFMAPSARSVQAQYRAKRRKTDEARRNASR
jgi:hypothetical protein